MKACSRVVKALSEARPVLGQQRQRRSWLTERSSNLSQSSAHEWQGCMERLIHLGFLKLVLFLTPVYPRKDASLTQSDHKAAVCKVRS